MGIRRRFQVNFHTFHITKLVYNHTFIFFIPETPVFIHTRESSDFGELSTRIQSLPHEFSVDETSFAVIPSGSYVFLDDFAFSRSNNKNDKLSFNFVVNYFLRHHKVTLFLIIHNLTGHNLFTDILLAPHIFLAYSSLGYYALR